MSSKALGADANIGDEFANFKLKGLLVSLTYPDSSSCGELKYLSSPRDITGDFVLRISIDDLSRLISTVFSFSSV